MYHLYISRLHYEFDRIQQVLFGVIISNALINGLHSLSSLSLDASVVVANKRDAEFNEILDVTDPPTHHSRATLE